MSLAVAAQDGLHVALDQHRLDVEQGHRAVGREPQHRAARSSTGRRRSPCRTTNRWSTTSAPKTSFRPTNSPGNNQLHDVRLRQGLPAQLALGIQVRRHVEERRGTRGKRGDENLRRAPANTDGGPRYYDTNHDGVLSREDLIYQGNADPYLYGGLQNTFYIHGFKLGVYFAYSLGGKIYNYSEIYMAGSQFANQYRYMLERLASRPQPELRHSARRSEERRRASERLHDPRRFVSAAEERHARRTRSTCKKKCSWMRDLTLSVSGENLFLWKKVQRIRPRRFQRGHLVDAAPYGPGRLSQAPHHHIQPPVEILNLYRIIRTMKLKTHIVYGRGHGHAFRSRHVRWTKTRRASRIPTTSSANFRNASRS